MGAGRGAAAMEGQEMKPARKTVKGVQPIPEGYHTITPTCVVRDAAGAIEFYKRAFGAEELGRMTEPDGERIVHAELRIGDSRFFLCDEIPEMGLRSPTTLGGTPCGFYLYVEDVDEAFKKAVGAGAKIKQPVSDMFWGDRIGSVTDPFGCQWDLATRKEEVPLEEIKRRGEEFFRSMSKKAH